MCRGQSEASVGPPSGHRCSRHRSFPPRCSPLAGFQRDSSPPRLARAVCGGPFGARWALSHHLPHVVDDYMTACRAEYRLAVNEGIVTLAFKDPVERKKMTDANLSLPRAPPPTPEFGTVTLVEAWDTGRLVRSLYSPVLEMAIVPCPLDGRPPPPLHARHAHRDSLGGCFARGRMGGWAALLVRCRGRLLAPVVGDCSIKRRLDTGLIGA